MRAAAAIALLALGIVGVVALRDATMSTHRAMPPNSRIALVFRADAHGAERGQGLEELAEAVLLSCRLEVKSDVVGPIDRLGDHEFRAVLQPSMDGSDRRQFRGCLEDWHVDHLRLDVVRLVELG